MSRPWLAALFALLPALVLHVATTRGVPGLTWDGLQYCSAATSLARDGQLNVPLANWTQFQFDATGALIPRHPLILWPPGYPLLIAGAMMFGAPDALIGASLVNAAALCVLLLTVFSVIRRAVDVPTATAATLVLGVTPAVQGLFRMALSEAPFVAATALMIAAVAAWLERPATRLRYLWAASACVAVAILLRYTGIFLFAAEVLVAGFTLGRSIEVRRRWLHVAAAVFAGPALGSAFLWHRLATLGCFTCESRGPSTVPLLENVGALLYSVVKSTPLLFEVVAGPFDSLLTASVMGVVLVTARPRVTRPAGERAIRACGVALTVGFVYAVGIVAIRTAIEFNSLDPRLVAPAALPVVTAALAAFFWTVRGQSRIAAATIIAMLLTAGSAFAAERTRWRFLIEPRFGSSAMMRFIATHYAHAPGVAVFTPEAAFVRAHLGFERPAYWLPPNGVPAIKAGDWALLVVRLSNGEMTADRVRELDGLAARTAAGDDFIAWRLDGTVSGLPQTPR